MMREILFRGKRKDNSEWVEGYYCGKVNETFFSPAKDSAQIIDDDLYWHEVIPETVGQFTSLTDKNGKKIFEGDIFKFPDEVWESSYTSCGTEWDSWEVENYGVIGFEEYTARFDFVQYRYNENSVEADLHENNCLEFAEFVKKLEVIGNIHDNPELLGGEDDV